MGKSSHFSGQPQRQGAEMDETASNHRLHNHHSHLQPAIAMDRAYIDHEKFQRFTECGVIYVIKMKRLLKYTVRSDTMYQTTEGLMEAHLQHVALTKQLKGGETIQHEARIITYCEVRKHKPISLLTNNMDSDPDEIIAI